MWDRIVKSRTRLPNLTVDGVTTMTGALTANGGIISSNYQSTIDASYISAGGAANYYMTLQALDTGVALVEVARLQGAADPYFSMGGSQEFKFYESGVATFGAVTLGGTVTINSQVFDAGSGNAEITTTGDLGLKMGGSLLSAEIASAVANVAGYGQVWVKNDAPNTPYFTDDAGTDHRIITGATGTKHEFHIPFEDPTGQVGYWDVVAINAAQDTHFVFQVPEDFESLVNARVVMIPDATETIQWDIYVSVSAAGEAYDNDDRSAVDQTLAVTANLLTEIDISGQLSGLAGGDYAAIDFQSDIADLRIIGFEFDYL